MESSEQDGSESFKTTLENNNLVVEDYEECISDEIATHLVEDEQSGEQILGYLEVQGHNGSQDATIYLDPQGLNLNGKRLILTQNDEGIIVVVSNDPNGQTLEDDSVIHSDSEQGTLVVDGTSQSLEFIKGEEGTGSSSQVYLDNDTIEIDSTSPIWSEEQTSKSSDMLFIPKSTVILAPEETKHPKLMQLAHIAHQLQTADSTHKECQETSVIVSPQEGFQADRTVDNVVSVIHSASSHLHGDLLEEALPSSDCEVSHMDSPTASHENCNDHVMAEEEKLIKCVDPDTSVENVAVNVEDMTSAKKIEENGEEEKLTEESITLNNCKETTYSKKEKDLFPKKEVITTILPKKRAFPMNMEKVNEYNFTDDDDLDMPLSKRTYYSPKKCSIFSSKSKVKTLFSTGSQSKLSFNNSASDHQQVSDCSKGETETESSAKKHVMAESEYDNIFAIEDTNVSHDALKFRPLKKRRAIVSQAAEKNTAQIFRHDSLLSSDQDTVKLSGGRCITDVITNTVVETTDSGINSTDLSPNSKPDHASQIMNPVLKSANEDAVSSVNIFVKTADSGLNDMTSDISSVVESLNSCLNSADSNKKNLSEDATEETTHVKPPKKTYIKKRAIKIADSGISSDKIELFSVDGFSGCDQDIEQAELSLRLDQEVPATASNESSNSNAGENSSAQIDTMPSVGIKVSATYNRKKKVPATTKQAWQLRKRSKKCTEEKVVENKDNNSENIAWADVLLRTSFETPNISEDSPQQATPSTEKKKRSPKKLKPESDFDSLLMQSPKSKSPSPKKVGKRLISDIVKKAKSRLKVKAQNKKGTNWNEFSDPKIKYRRGVKRAQIRFSVRPKKKYDHEKVYDAVNEADFMCSSCDFVSSLVNNLIEHLKYCEKRQPPLDYPVDDMDKRQRIRGEDTTDNLLDSFDSAVRGECSGASQNNYDSDDETKRKYGYTEDDIVWAKVEDRFWPALVCKVRSGKAYVKLINYPTELKGLKKPVGQVHTFNDAKWNTMLLAEATDLPHNEIFVKAVQTSETYVRKQWLGLSVKGKDFFSILDEVVFMTDEESCDSAVNEDSDTDADTAIKPSTKARYQKLNIQGIKDYILKGNLDDYVLDIYHRRISSQKHIRYFSDGGGEKTLVQGTWFGPCEKKFEQGVLVDYFHSLFRNAIGERHYYLSYIMQVWIPEAIVKAISDMHKIPLKEAETLFESDDSQKGKSDPTIEEIEKMYS